MTHAGNAMAGIDHRAPGPITAAVLDGRATLEVIADGLHLHPGFVSLLWAVAGDRMVAVTDAMSACGMAPGAYGLGTSKVVVAGGRVSLADDPSTLAGNALTLDRAVATLVAGGMDLSTAIAASSTPAGAVGATGKAQLRAGEDADLVVLDEDLHAVATVIDGTVAWDPEGRLVGVGVCRPGRAPA